MKTPDKFPAYGSTYNGIMLFTIAKDNEEKLKTPTTIFCGNNLVVTYYDYVPANTTENSYGVTILTKKQFYSRIREIKQKYGVNFTIKTKW